MSDGNLVKRGGVWYGRIQEGGRDVRRSLRTGDKAEAKRRLRGFLQQNSGRAGTIRTSYVEAAGAWIVVAKGTKTAKTWDRYRLSLRTLEPFFKGKFLDQIDRNSVMSFIEARTAGGCTIATVRRDLTVLSGIFEFAAAKEWVKDNPVRQIPRMLLRHRTPVFRRAPQSDIDLLLSKCSAHLRDLAEFYLETGMRRDEARLLTAEQVNLTNGTARLDVTKNRTVRTIRLSPRALELVRARGVTSGPIFLNKDGKPFLWVSEAVRDAGYHAAKEAGPGYVRYSVHDFRHEYAIRYLERGGNLYALQMQLGHSSLKQTEWYLQFLAHDDQLRVRTDTT